MRTREHASYVGVMRGMSYCDVIHSIAAVSHFSTVTVSRLSGFVMPRLSRFRRPLKSVDGR
jgi:hypothetical protein